MKKAVIYIFILGFICIIFGALLGIVIHKKYIKKHMLRVIKQYYLKTTPEQRQQVITTQILKALKHELNLSAEQLNRVKDILSQATPEVKEAVGAFRDELAEIRAKIIPQVFEILDKQQQVKFKNILHDNKVEVKDF